MIERVDQCSGPLTIGRLYLVPAIWWQRERKRPLWWPVIGPKHEDAEFLNFPWLHYHVDVRFVNRNHLAQHYRRFDEMPRALAKIADILAQPLSHTGMPDAPPAPQWRRMKCQRAEIIYPYGFTTQVQNINAHFAGAQCARSKAGWICPHRHAPLASIAPIDGVITCPLHGLKINAETGRVITVS